MGSEIDLIKKLDNCDILFMLGNFFLKKEKNLNMALECAKQMMLIGESNKTSKCFQDGYKLFTDINTALHN